MIVLGIDPGSINCGYGVILFENNSFKVLDFGIIYAKLNTEDFNQRLIYIYSEIEKIIKKHNPEFLAIEKTFFYKNPQSLIKLSHARASAILVAGNLSLKINEYSPNEVKQSVSGRGKASKEQVSFMVKTILNIDSIDKLYDSSDALSIAICHCLKYKRDESMNFNSNANKLKRKTEDGKIKTLQKNSWENFVKNNPTKISK